MRKLLLPVLLLMFFGYANGQTIIESFDVDDILADGTYKTNVEGDKSSLNLSRNTTDVKEGTASLNFNAVIGEYHEWGSYAQLIKRVPDSTSLDWSISDTISIWIKVIEAPTHPEYMVFRFHIADRPTAADPVEEYIYENGVVLDATSDWVNLKVPLLERETDGTTVPNDEGFVIAPTTWGGFTYNNRELDRDKIIGYNISAIVSGYTAGVNLPADSVKFIIDGFERSGMRSVPAIIFNGIQWPTYAGTPWAWGQSTISVEAGAGYTPGSNAIKWVQGNEWSNGWTGFGANINPPFNLGGSWPQDSIQFKLKCEEGVGALRVQFEDGTGKVGTVFTPITDNQWHLYKLPLREMVFQDATSSFDSTAVSVWGLMAEASGIAGKVIYVTDIWTGNPDFDVIPPNPPTDVAGISQEFQNVITWTDVPNETSEIYDVYYSKSPITDVSTADVVALGIAEGLQITEHLLIAPATNQPVTYYYAVVCRDAAGNSGAVSTSSAAVTNTARGVPTITLTTPAFNPDGMLDEWQAITPILLSPVDGNAYPAPNSLFDSNADLYVKSYLAMDNDYLYVAFDIEDDVVSTDVSTNSYENDCPDLFIGLYNQRGRVHTSYQRGAQPDYHFRFNIAKAIIDGGGVAKSDSLLLPGADYIWQAKFPTGYAVEARLAWTKLGEVGPDNVFIPHEGYRIPIDFSINDADGALREGILCYSRNNNDLSYQSPSRWTNTWIGNLWDPVGVDDEEVLVENYALMQNYPNPFNPATQISYSIKSAGMVSLKVYDMLGREIATLVNENQNAGRYTVNFNASNLASGVYLYKIDAGSYHSTMKMMLIK